MTASSLKVNIWGIVLGFLLLWRDTILMAIFIKTFLSEGEKIKEIQILSDGNFLLYFIMKILSEESLLLLYTAS